MNTVEQFNGEYAFLSNFFPSPFSYDGCLWPTVEHAYQAMKTLDRDQQEKIRMMEKPGQTKKAGRHVTLRDDWEKIKIDVMRRLVFEKFSQNPDLKDKLIATFPNVLEEGNSWHDRTWGISPAGSGKGKNYLGRILMQIRGRLHSGTVFDLLLQELDDV